MRKNWGLVLILVIIGSLLLAGCSGGGEAKSEGEGGAGEGSSAIANEVKEAKEKVLDGQKSFERVAEAYQSEPSTETLEALVVFAEEQIKELGSVGMEAANIAAEAKEEAEAKPVNAVVEVIEEAKGLMKELGKNAEASIKALEAAEPEPSKYLSTVQNVKASIEEIEKFYETAKGEEGGEGH